MILRLIVRSFIETAGPIGSRTLTRRYPLGLSPASVRNTMGDLEEMGYLQHPYTSAGRMPTELGYRAFVDQLMELPDLTLTEKKILRGRLDRLIGDAEELFKESSRLLTQMSNLFGVVLSPRISRGILERLEVVPLTSPRVLIVISVRSRQVKTIAYETKVDFDRHALERIVAILNERLAGLRLDEIRRTYADRTRDIEDEKTGIVRLIRNESCILFSDAVEGRVSHGGAYRMLSQPEFQDTEDVRRLIELIEDEERVVQLFEQQGREQERSGRLGRVQVSIGSEVNDATTDTYSLVTARYRVGETVGTVGVLGPTRMDYSRVVALVKNMAFLLDRSVFTSTG